MGITEGKVLVMYDIRGIQKYIYRTDKVKDAIGASYIVETVILNALKDAIAHSDKVEQNRCQLKWYDEKGPLEFLEEDLDIQVLYIGGGNAYVLFRDKELCVHINQMMSKYVLEHTYSLQLTIAICEKTENYSADYTKIQQRMNENKANMVVSKPVGAMPVMRVELKTGFPAVSRDNQSGKEIGEETRLKRAAYRRKCEIETDAFVREEQIFDNLVTQKGVDSNLAVVHIDGNGMGLRIRRLVEGIGDYEGAVNKMREISYQIMNSYKEVFRSMHDYFTSQVENRGISQKRDKYVVREILIAGDDVTYVCNACIALASVEYFCKEISRRSMVRGNDVDTIKKYGFSVCAGVAFISSHFPFRIGYEVAERCCDSAKKRAKSRECKDDYKFTESGGKRELTIERVGNFVDFQICKNIQSQNLEEMRKKDYITPSGEQLLVRPYYISTGLSIEEEPLEKNRNRIYSYDKLKEGIQYFSKGADVFPRSFAKQLRNTYPMGQNQVMLLQSFLESRGWKMPDGDDVLYFQNEDQVIAKWYDALEMLDYYIDFEEGEGGNER